ncbi:poly(A) polymerase [Actinoplanes couchii]|uniref:Endonuclease/exonuclease/phosphatase n=1 Tax=Actinoplanes couchii TaxID=403638 RepID=A0ABQ3XE85_9ACTN|nr:poly(A) polymerase [Actinoplanes couchii]MDR6317323.1 endonuclease/exonuclease/phosphatase family metal-dependent hydrolase/2'-5' RNA ligase/uncharacterized protein (UPF0248 family) [Actinoplanes couchii]GID56816.1 hypothetical protein Aco03nite_052200 [Actinoplanes couchii]
MRTSEEIYHRVRWDPRLDPARFVLGVDVRAADAKRVPLPAFVPGGDIPWHRVLFIEADGERVWDRGTGVDRIDTTTAGRVREPRRLDAPFFTARTPHSWTGGWVPAPPGRSESVTTLRVLTWNTLWDRYDADLIDTARRRPLLLDLLERADADVIALQEVERGLLEQLLAAEWVRRDYTLCTDPAGKDVDDSGVLLLSRVPVLESARHVLGPYKQVTAITVGGPVVIAAVHLTSDHSADGAGRREVELSALGGGLAGMDVPVLVVGDLNDGSDTPSRRLGMRDAWAEVHGPDDETVTFDPIRNPLAAVGSLTGRGARLDRVLIRGAELNPLVTGLVGDAPVEGLCASDHYGVSVDVAVGDASMEDVAGRPAAFSAGWPAALPAPRTTARSAVAWLPPRELWPAIQEVRRAHDPQFDRWPPHVNVLFGFLPEADFEEAATLLAGATAEIPPFQTTIAGVRSFTQRDDATIWLDPASSGSASWEAVHRAAQRRFPQCRDRAEGWTPHLTVGRDSKPSTTARVDHPGPSTSATRDGRAGASSAAARVGPVTAWVDRLTLLSRRGDEPMVPRAEVMLGTGEVRWLPEGTGEVRRPPEPPPEPLPPEPVTVSVAGVIEEIRAAIPDGVVHLAGSRRLGCELPGADLDLVAVLPATAGLPERLAAAGWSVRPVIGARVPGLRLSRSGLDVDLVTVFLDGTGSSSGTASTRSFGGAASTGSFGGAALAGAGGALGGVAVGDAVARRGELGDASAIALSAVSDAEAVLAATAGVPGFVPLARAVKGWARARGLDSAPFGGLPGVAWVVLAARTAIDARSAIDDGGLSPAALLERFFETWAAWDWAEPVGLHGVAAGDFPSYPMTILTPSSPVRSCTDQVGSGIRDLLAQEMYQAWEGQAPTPPHRRHRDWAVVTVEPVSGELFDETVGRFRGRVRSLLTMLEEAGMVDVHAWPRPFTVTPVRRDYAIGLGRRPPPPGLLANWSAGLPGVTLTQVDGGSVPTLR